MKKLLPVSFLFLLPVFASAQSTGFMSPTAVANPSGGWMNPIEAFTSDDLYTSVPHQSGCRCPFLFLSWDNGVSYTNLNIIGPFGETDNTLTAGSSSDLWGHSWTTSELTNANFRLKIANPSTLIEQGYADFNFTFPMGATIAGIEVNVEEHGDSAFTTEYIDLIQVNVHYTVTTGMLDLLAATINVFPNPANDFVTVANISEGTQSVRLYDMTGRTVFETAFISSDRLVIDVTEFPAGLYILEVREEKAVLTRKIVVE